MKRPTDWNDLHAAHGLTEVRRQFESAAKAQQNVAADSPATSFDEAAPEVTDFTIDTVLQRFSLVEGSTKVFDHDRVRELKKSAFTMLVGKDLAKQWESHDRRRVLNDAAARRLVLEGAGGGQLTQTIDRFWHIMPTKDAWDAMQRERVPVEVLKIKLGANYPSWLNHPQRKEIRNEQLVFDPSNRVPAGCVNTYEGLPLEPIDNEMECASIREALAHLCNYDDDIIHWVTCWLALPLKKPGTKLATAMLFDSSVQGSGKSYLFADIHRRLYGRYSAVVGQHQLESQYTEWRSQCMFSVFEEILSQSTKYNHSGTMKHMVTGKVQRIDKKFVSGWEESNFMNCVFLSNELLPFPIDASDRRYLVVWPNKKMPDGLKKALDYEATHQGVESWLGYLLKYNIGDFTAYTEPLMTEARQRIIEMSMRSYESFYKQWHDGELDAPYQTCLSMDLFEVYVRWCSRVHESASSWRMFCGFMQTREKKKFTKYTVGQSRKDGTVLVVGEKPYDMSESDWLGREVAKFKKAANISDGYKDKAA